jgi:hypothetical protein
MHLAQLNIAELLFPADDPAVADFMDNIDRINAIAERSQGFIWRLKDESNNATGIASPWGERFIVNMSVWSSPSALEHFVWNTLHKHFYNRKHEWFRTMKSNHFVMWPVEEGHRPDLTEAKTRLDCLNDNGDSNRAFSWAYLPQIGLWQEQRCS